MDGGDGRRDGGARRAQLGRSGGLTGGRDLIEFKEDGVKDGVGVESQSVLEPRPRCGQDGNSAVCVGDRDSDSPAGAPVSRA